MKYHIQVSFDNCKTWKRSIELYYSIECNSLKELNELVDNYTKDSGKGDSWRVGFRWKHDGYPGIFRAVNTKTGEEVKPK